MTFGEFKTWLQGFRDALGGPPNEAQWAMVVEKLEAVTEPAFDLSKLVVPSVLGPAPQHPSIPPHPYTLPYNTCKANGLQDPSIRAWNGDEGTRISQ